MLAMVRKAKSLYGAYWIDEERVKRSVYVVRRNFMKYVHILEASSLNGKYIKHKSVSLPLMEISPQHIS